MRDARNEKKKKHQNDDEKGIKKKERERERERERSSSRSHQFFFSLAPTENSLALLCGKVAKSPLVQKETNAVSR